MRASHVSLHPTESKQFWSYNLHRLDPCVLHSQHEFHRSETRLHRRVCFGSLHDPQRQFLVAVQLPLRGTSWAFPFYLQATNALLTLFAEETANEQRVVHLLTAAVPPRPMYSKSQREKLKASLRLPRVIPNTSSSGVFILSKHSFRFERGI